MQTCKHANKQKHQLATLNQNKKNLFNLFLTNSLGHYRLLRFGLDLSFNNRLELDLILQTTKVGEVLIDDVVDDVCSTRLCVLGSGDKNGNGLSLVTIY